MLGMIQADLGRTEEATRALAAALAVRPDLTPARLRLASLLVQESRCTEALQLLQDGRRLTPNDPALIQTLGQLQTICARQ